MKINQLFSQPVDVSVLNSVLTSFGLLGLHDRRTFTRNDMVALRTVERLYAEALPRLRSCYIPCKARTYLDDLTEKRALTVLKQVLRLHAYTLVARERSVGGRKVVVYHLQSIDGSGGCDLVVRPASSVVPTSLDPSSSVGRTIRIEFD